MGKCILIEYSLSLKAYEGKQIGTCMHKVYNSSRTEHIFDVLAN